MKLQNLLPGLVLLGSLGFAGVSQAVTPPPTSTPGPTGVSVKVAPLTAGFSGSYANKTELLTNGQKNYNNRSSVAGYLTTAGAPAKIDTNANIDNTSGVVDVGASTKTGDSTLNGTGLQLLTPGAPAPTGI